MIKKYLEMLEKFKEDFKNDDYRFQEIINKFEDSTFEKICYLKDKSNEFNLDDWQHFYRENKDDPIVVLDVLTNCSKPIELTNEIVEDLLSEIEKMKPPYVSTSNYTYTNIKDMLQQSLCSDMSPELQKRIYKTGSKDVVFYIDENIEKMPPSVINSFCEFAIDNISEYVQDNYLELTTGKLREIFEHINDRKILDNLINKLNFNVDNEIVRTFIINSPLLSIDDEKDVKIINQLFEDGCEYTKLKKFTPYIIEFLANNFTNIDNPNTFADKEKYEDLKKLISFGALPSSLEYDLAMKLMFDRQTRLSKYSSDLIVKIFESTKNEAILSKINFLSIKNRKVVLSTNPHVPTAIYKKVSNDFFDKLYTNKGSHIIALEKYSLKTAFRDKDYDYILNNCLGRNDFIRNAVRSFFTPEHILNKIIDKCSETLTKTEIETDLSYPEKALLFGCMIFNFYAKINLAHQHGLITEDQANCLYKCCDKAYNSQILPEDFHDVKFDTQSLCNSYDMSYYYDIYMDINTREKRDEVIKIIDKIFEVSTNENPIMIQSYKNFAEHIKEIINYFHDMQYIDNNKNYSTYTDKQLTDIYNKFTDLSLFASDFSFNSLRRLNFYRKLPKKYEEFIAISYERTKRNLKDLFETSKNSPQKVSQEKDL